MNQSRLLLCTEYYRLYCHPVNDAIARQLERPLSLRIDKLQITLGVKPAETVDIEIIPDRQTYQFLTVGKGRIVEFSEAIYDRNERRIYVRSPDQVNDDYLLILLHEYIHWLVDSIFLDAPLWFHEGMATYFSGQFGFEKHVQFLQMRFWGRYLPLSEMRHIYPKDQPDWQLFYLTSSFSMHYIMNKRIDDWNRMWDKIALKEGINRRLLFYPFFQQSFNQSVSDFTRDYDRYARRLAYLYIFYGINALIFTLLPLFILIGWWKRRRRMRQLPDPSIEESIEDEEENEPHDNEERMEP